MRDVLANEYGQVGMLRFRKAELEGDLTVMQNLVNQYPGTNAAGAALAWLGDRALSGGDFGSAFANYSAALPIAPSEYSTELPARQRLAAALMGRDFGQPVTSLVSIGEQRLTGEEFETQVRELRDQHRRAAGIAAPTEQRAPLAGKLELKKIGTTEGDAGDRVGDFPETLNLMFDQGKRFDWAVRQMSLIPSATNCCGRIVISLRCSSKAGSCFGDPRSTTITERPMTGSLSRCVRWSSAIEYTPAACPSPAQN